MEPLAENIIPLRKNGRRNWQALSDDEMIIFAKEFISVTGIRSRKELDEADRGLYQALRKRKLLDRIGLEDSNANHRDWAAMSDEELDRFAKEFMAEKGIDGRHELDRADHRLYDVLRRRKLLDKIGLLKKHRNWAAMSDEELVAFAKRFIAERGIGGRKELYEANQNLYNILSKRKLLDKIGLLKKHRNWAAMSDEELVAFAKRFIAERGIGGRKELQKVDSGLYQALRKRKLLDELGLEDSHAEHRNWAAMDDVELVIIAKELMAEKEVGGRRRLEKADPGLYHILLRRKLLDAAFSNIELEKHAETVQGVLDALETFGDPDA